MWLATLQVVGRPTSYLITIAGKAESVDCVSAKTHLCSKIQGQGCQTSTMATARDNVFKGCGGTVAATFPSAAASYCSSAGDSFSVSDCAKL